MFSAGGLNSRTRNLRGVLGLVLLSQRCEGEGANLGLVQCRQGRRDAFDDGELGWSSGGCERDGLEVDARVDGDELISVQGCSCLMLE